MLCHVWLPLQSAKRGCQIPAGHRQSRVCTRHISLVLSRLYAPSLEWQASRARSCMLRARTTMPTCCCASPYRGVHYMWRVQHEPCLWARAVLVQYIFGVHVVNDGDVLGSGHCARFYVAQVCANMLRICPVPLSRESVDNHSISVSTWSGLPSSSTALCRPFATTDELTPRGA